MHCPPLQTRVISTWSPFLHISYTNFTSGNLPFPIFSEKVSGGICSSPSSFRYGPRFTLGLGWLCAQILDHRDWFRNEHVAQSEPPRRHWATFTVASGGGGWGSAFFFLCGKHWKKFSVLLLLQQGLVSGCQSHCSDEGRSYQSEVNTEDTG